eukprot:CAMPEP_0195029172 /NCGR_PEP_ID=MMETSP0326_2-20130528/56082_1 /TAXON_ID=2866 ORGANISM="Crypthecodinium cohnii, Strain Seligo" /NCGR_SAMPLE_ID=MMETSP0326_2 /ASSEMBLY_ACC=CAM_ASM_000348 /LENGTH=116 /DNA_ID=CAMNT_0040051967 /DNA_START=128 /DNA_END=476 /DNA_ORIENTATION=+
MSLPTSKTSDMHAVLWWAAGPRQFRDELSKALSSREPLVASIAKTCFLHLANLRAIIARQTTPDSSALARIQGASEQAGVLAFCLLLDPGVFRLADGWEEAPCMEAAVNACNVDQS